MIRSINTLNRNMNILQKKQENTSNNIANTNTPGYKYQEIVQSTMENHTMFNYTDGREASGRRELGNWVFGNEIDQVYTNTNQGQFVETGDPLDYAIPDRSYFSVDLTGGERAYTRNGNFALDTNNRLVTMEGHQVVGTLADGTESDILVDQNGNIQNGARLRLVEFPEGAELERIGDTLFTDPAGQGQVVDGEAVKGFLEMSNVIVADEMVRLIQIAREFEANQKALQTSDETLSKTVNDIGRV